MTEKNRFERLASQIRASRAALELSQAGLAKLAGVSTVTLARIEAMSSNPTHSSIEAIFRAIKKLGVTVVDNAPDGGFTLVIKKVNPVDNT